MPSAENSRFFSGEFVFVNHDNSRGGPFKARKTSIRSHLSGDYRIWLSKHRSKRLLNPGQSPQPRSPTIRPATLNKSWADVRAAQAAKTRRKNAMARASKGGAKSSQGSRPSSSPTAGPQRTPGRLSTPEPMERFPRSLPTRPALAPHVSSHTRTTHAVAHRIDNSTRKTVTTMARSVVLPPTMPYNIFPVEKNEGVAQGWQYFAGVIGPSLLRRPGQDSVDAGFLQQTLSHILNDNMLFCVYMAASMIYLLRHHPFKTLDHWRQQRFQLCAVRELQKCINSPNAAVSLSDAVVITIVTLAIIEYFAGNYDALRTHVMGLRKIVELKGGLDKFGWGGFVRLRVISLFCFWEHLEARPRWRGNVLADEYREWQSSALGRDQQTPPSAIPKGFIEMSGKHYLRPDLLGLISVLRLAQQGQNDDRDPKSGGDDLPGPIDNLGMNGVVCNEIMWKGHFRFAEYLVATSLLQYLISKMLTTKPPGVMPMLGIFMISVQMYCWKLQLALSKDAGNLSGTNIDTTEKYLTWAAMILFATSAPNSEPWKLADMLRPLRHLTQDSLKENTDDIHDFLWDHTLQASLQFRFLPAGNNAISDPSQGTS